MKTEAESQELHDLMEAALNGELTEDGARRLEEILDRDPEARTLYVRYLGLDTDLWLGTDQAPSRRGRIPSAPRARPRPPAAWTRAFPLGFAAATLLFAALTVLRPAPGPREAATRVPVAHLARTLDARPADLDVGLSRVVGLESGTAEILFAGGSRVLLQDRTDLLPEWTHRAVLRTGRVTIRVPPGDLGFTLDTPNATITTHGGEFGVEVTGADSTDVTVLGGELEVRRVTRDGPPPQEEAFTYHVLSAGQSSRIASDGMSPSDPALPDRFLWFAAFTKRTRRIALEDDFSGPGPDPSRWEAVLRAPRSGIRVEDGRAVLANRGWLVTAEAFDPVRLGGVRVRGRWSFAGPTEGGGSAQVNIFSVVLRASLEEGPAYHEAGSGIKFNCFSNNGRIYVASEGPAFQLSRNRPRGFLKEVGKIETYAFEIVDDGVGVTFTVWDEAEPANRSQARTTVLRDASGDDRIVFYGREFHDPDRRYEVRLDDVAIETGIAP